MKYLLNLLFILCVFSSLIFPQDYKVLESNGNYLIVEFNFENKYIVRDTLIEGFRFQYITGDEFCFGNPGEPALPSVSVNVGIPFNGNPAVKVLNITQEKISKVFLLPYPDSLGQPLNKLHFADSIYNSNKFYPQTASQVRSTAIARYIRLAGLTISPFQFNPISRELLFNKKLQIRVDFNTTKLLPQTVVKVDDPMTMNIIKSNCINAREAFGFAGKIINTTNTAKINNSFWYDSQKDYWKIYLNQKGVYRITYEYLAGLGIPEFELQKGNFEIFNENAQVPIDIVDVNQDSLFNEGDYFQFVGYNVKPVGDYTYLNIYNLENVYWLSYQADSSALKYKNKNGYPDNWNQTFQESPFVLHFEKDSLYERLGHAPNDKRDFWYWGKTSGENGVLSSLFDPSFKLPEGISADSQNITLRVNMHGMTTSNCINPDHKIKIFLTSQLVGVHTFDGPNSSTFEKTFSIKDIALFETNNLQVAAYGDITPCTPGESTSDEIRVNWFEVEYWRYHRAANNNFWFTSPPNATGKTRFNVFNWKRNNMKIYIPQRGEVIKNPLFTNDAYNSTLFVDSLTDRVDYFCAADDYYLLPDSVVRDNPSNLHSASNAADYIIITHEKFTSVANRLAELRQNDFPDTSIQNPRIAVIQVQDIYDEFSAGLMNPYGIQSFIKYAFENWQKPSPKYVVLVGDMSYDYRHINQNSRPNFIPAIPFQAFQYGQAASDNGFVAVAGTDLLPDLAIGRLSCETVEEGNILVDKLASYPADQSKEWKQNVLLIASGQDAADEQLFGFNSASFTLDDLYVRPSGATGTKIFRYPRLPRDFPFYGEGPKIRQEFNNGAVLASYYGHGGGYQWDLVFLNDDIYQLQNEWRLPFISSVTCYTAHFDNQDVFGEQFNKVPGKGSISFWGSSGLTWWSIGQGINHFAFSRIFKNKDYICGDFILKSKYQLGSGDAYRDSQIALLTLLGDPILKLALPEKPDFQVKSADISIDPISPKTNEPVYVKVKIRNLGVVFPGQECKVELVASSAAASYSVDTLGLQSFGEYDSLVFTWIPSEAGLYNLSVRVNNIDVIPEEDYSDNEAAASFAVYDLNKPNIIYPIDGFSGPLAELKFLFIDNGHYLGMNLQYFIEIDSTLTFQNPIIKTPAILPNDGFVKYVIPSLSEGKYFWRARILTESDSSQWSDTRTFSISSAINDKYSVSEKQLKMFELNNVIYSDSLKSLILITKNLPPRPSNETFMEEFKLETDSKNVLSSLATDGKYIYYASMAYYNNLLPTKIYRMGTGNLGTVKGENYGPVPNIEVTLWHTMFAYSDGYLYAATGDAYSLLRINPEQGTSDIVHIPSGMLNQSGLVRDGAFYLNTDGRYVYNLSYFDSLQRKKYVLRIFDPLNNWVKIKEDLVLNGLSYDYFASFFVSMGYVYAYENGESGFLRKFNTDDGFYEEEWLSFIPYKGFYTWCYDWVNDCVYSSVFRDGYSPSIFKFAGSYKKDFGSLTSAEVGPAQKWENISFELDADGSAGSYTGSLLGFNKNTSSWEILNQNLPNTFNLTNINSAVYNKLKLRVDMKDSTFGASVPLKFKKMELAYQQLPEICLTKGNVTFQPDSILQGFPTSVTLKALNVGKTNADSLSIEFFLDDADAALYKGFVNVPADSSSNLEFTIQTDQLAPHAFHKIKAIANLPNREEYFVYNNIIENYFFVVRDSVKPIFSITVDGKEILDGDIVSAKPEVLITLTDDSPLPLDTSLFTIIHNNVPLIFNNPNVQYSYTPYPNSSAVIKWHPELKDGKHTLEVLAKDASGNFFDTTSSRTIFYVYNNPDLLNIFNYPNPFTNETYFTFELRGTFVPDEFVIRIFTITGRLIKVILIKPEQMSIGFNRIYWDGKDEDGDEISNGVYFYKVISRLGDETKVVTQKLAKVK